MRRFVTLGTLGLLSLGAAMLILARDDGFPHERHEGLFPTCEGCHAGIAGEDSATAVSITPEDCAGCHDGTELVRVSWTEPRFEPSNLDFSHAEHSSVVLELACVDCHRRPGVEARMAVSGPVPETCLQCHAEEASEHYAVAEVKCAKCHLPLAGATALPVARIAEFPQPRSHGAADFLLIHGETASADATGCAVCHTRDSCERCHLDAASVPAIADLPNDGRVASLVADRAGEWPEPDSHTATDWAVVHQQSAREDVTTCATCHARESCETCHGVGRPTVASRLPTRRPGGPVGVRVTATAIVAVGHNPTFFDRHGTAAAIGMPQCSNCHAEKECIACHDGVEKPGFHPLDFVMRHGADAFAERTECAACHSREAFCRDCHSSLSVAAQGRSGPSFHDAQPDWLLAHGQAARRDLEACTTCHEERSCLRCHSAKTGWRVSPHGPDFDPDHVADKSTQSCAICHFSLPTEASP